MIGKEVWVYCSGDVSKIENYESAIKDHDVVWHCHHKREVLSDGGKITKKELKKMNLYFNRPPEELIFLLPKDHLFLHLGKHKSFEYLKKINSFADFLNKKREIQKKYKVWIERNPDYKEILEEEKNKIICELLDGFEKKERKKLKKLDEIKECRIKINVKFLPKGF